MAIDVPLLARICEAPGAPGFEKKIRELVLKELKETKGLVDSVRIDNMGNVVALKKGRSSKKDYWLIASLADIPSKRAKMQARTLKEAPTLEGQQEIRF